MDEALIQEQEAQLQKTGRYYKHICFMAIPLLCMSCYLYGLRPLLLCGIAVLTGNLCDRLVSLLRRRVSGRVKGVAAVAAEDLLADEYTGQHRRHQHIDIHRGGHEQGDDKAEALV